MADLGWLNSWTNNCPPPVTLPTNVALDGIHIKKDSCKDFDFHSSVYLVRNTVLTELKYIPEENQLLNKPYIFELYSI